MIKSPYQLRKERLQIRLAAEREKDTIYYLDFVPKNGHPAGCSTMLKDLWCVRLFRNPENNPKVVEDAIRTFEERHKVSSWQDIAIRHDVQSLWNPRLRALTSHQCFQNPARGWGNEISCDCWCGINARLQFFAAPPAMRGRIGGRAGATRGARAEQGAAGNSRGGFSQIITHGSCAPLLCQCFVPAPAEPELGRSPK
jgi:hypothetical protein